MEPSEAELAFLGEGAFEAVDIAFAGIGATAAH